MSTGKRLAKRSIIGTRVCAPGPGDGKFYSGIIQAVKTPANMHENTNCINLTPDTKYTVRFDSRQGSLGRTTAEFHETELIGPGFRSILGLSLVPEQKCFVTYNGREVSGEVVRHDLDTDQVLIRIQYSGMQENFFELEKRLEEVRLLESRKSARLADQDTDFARLADVCSDRKRTASHTIDVPNGFGSRKRRPSYSQDENGQDSQMDECSAALVLMSLSCSPNSPNFANGIPWLSPTPDSSLSSSSSSRSTPSPTPSNGQYPPLSSSVSDEGIGLDYYPDEVPKKKKSRIIFKCTWPNCAKTTNSCDVIEAHVRKEHLSNRVVHPGEEEFYYTELEMSPTSSPPTLSHRDMARPSHEDPDFQRQLVGTIRQNLMTNAMNNANCGAVNLLPQSPHKLMKLSPGGVGSPSNVTGNITGAVSSKFPISPKRVRGENKKCRKVYGMDHRDQWCTQCKWKKACSRFGD